MYSFIIPVVLLSIFGSNAAVDYTNHTTMDEGRFKVWWTYNNESETFYFKLDVEAKGWIGFGFTQLRWGGDWMLNGMDQYDVLVGGVYSNNGSAYGLDYLTVGHNRTQYPDHVDDINDWVITDSEETGNRTILEFNRKRTTEEPLDIKHSPRRGDITIVPGLRYFVWAYHKTLDTPYLSNITYRHDKSGKQLVMLLPVTPEKREEPTGAESGERGAASKLRGSVAFIVTLVVLVSCFWY